MSTSELPAGQAPVLHVLAGANAGAEMPLAIGDWLIGTGEDADLTFAEPALAARHMRLRLKPAAVLLEVLAEGVCVGGRQVPGEAEIDLPLLVPVRIGTTLFALGAPGSDWSEVASEASPAAEEPVEAEPPPEAASTPANGDPAAPAAAATEPELVAGPAPVSWRGRWREPPVARAALPVLAALLVSIGGLAWYGFGSSGPSGRTTHAEPLRELRTAIREMGFQDTVSAAPRSQGRFVVSGQLGTDEELRKLTAALHRTGLPVDIAITTESGIVELSGTILHAFGIEGSVALTGLGMLELRGFAPSSASADAAVLRLRGEVPGVRNVEDRLVTPERARDVIDARIRSAGLSQVLHVTVADRRLLVAGLLPPEQIAVWNGIAEQFRNEYRNQITLVAEVAGPTRMTPTGVILGRVPHMVMEDGSRVSIGQVVENIGRVMSIDARRVRVQTPAGPVDIPFARTPNWILEDKDDQTR